MNENQKQLEDLVFGFRYTQEQAECKTIKSATALLETYGPHAHHILVPALLGCDPLPKSPYRMVLDQKKPECKLKAVKAGDGEILSGALISVRYSGYTIAVIVLSQIISKEELGKVSEELRRRMESRDCSVLFVQQHQTKKKRTKESMETV